MNPFHAAQSADPLDPVPILVWADHLEETGDATGAAVLRGLIDNGYPSVHALSLAVGITPSTIVPDDFIPWFGAGFGDTHELRLSHPTDELLHDYDSPNGLGNAVADGFADADGLGQGRGQRDRCEVWSDGFADLDLNDDHHGGADPRPLPRRSVNG